MTQSDKAAGHNTYPIRFAAEARRTEVVGADEPLRTRMLELGAEVAAARDKAARDAVTFKRLTTECEDLHQELGNAHHRNRVLEQQVLALFGPASTPAYQGTKVRAAIADARHVFEGEKVAEDVLHYLEQVLAAGVPVPAQTGTAPGGVNASIAEEGLAAAGAAPVVGPDPFRVAARQAVMRQARADLTQGEGAPVAGSEWPAWARELDEVAANMKRIEAATGELFGQLANILGTAGADTFNQAAAAMAAESAQKVADAERTGVFRDTRPRIDEASTPATIAHLVVEVDTTQLDAALAKAEQLKLALSCSRVGA